MDNKKKRFKKKKGGKKGKKSKKTEVETDQMKEAQKMEEIAGLVTKIGWTEEDLLVNIFHTNQRSMVAYDDFHAENPSGEIGLDKFLKISKAGLLADSLFRVFDEDKSGELNFFEFMQANNVTNLDTPEDKLNWIFTAFDTDGGGTIDVEEIRDIVVGLFRLAGIEEDEDLIFACVSDVREAIDTEGDGEVSKEEFVVNATQSKFIFNMLKN